MPRFERLEVLILKIHDLILAQNKLLQILISDQNKPPNKESNKENKEIEGSKGVSPQPLPKRRESSITNKDLVTKNVKEEDSSLLDDIEISSNQNEQNKKSMRLNKTMYAILISWWNNEIVPLTFAPRLIRWTLPRQIAISNRLKENPNLLVEIKEEMNQLNDWVKEKRFITFDWLMKPSNLQKVLEGNFRRKDKINAKQQLTDEEAAAEYDRLYRQKAGDNKEIKDAIGIQMEFTEWSSGDIRTDGDKSE